MKDFDYYEQSAADFLELASEQRMKIIFSLMEKKSRVSTMSKKLGVTAQEIHRNFDRLANAGFIKKGTDGFYHITTFGRSVCRQIPSITFLSKNRKYFEDHEIGDLPIKFIQRIGSFENANHIGGVVRVLEKWKSIYKNASEYVFEVIHELPPDLIEVLLKRLKSGIKLHHIISENAKVPKGTRKLYQKYKFDELLEKKKVQRQMKKKVSVSVILNDKEAIVMFPNKKGITDLTQMFFGTDEQFHEWCEDYFKYCWNTSDSFRIHKLKE